MTQDQTLRGRSPLSSLVGRIAPPSLPAALAVGLLALGSCGSEVAPAADGESAQAPSEQSSSPAPQAAPTAKATPSAQEAVDPHAGHDHAAGEAEPLPSARSSTLAEMTKDGKLEVDASDHDFGSAVEGEVLRHTFNLKSAGDGDLIITTAKPTCGCTVSKLEVKDSEGDWVLYTFGDGIKPGTDLRLTAELDTKNKKNVAQSKINVFCNDPRGTITLGLKAMLDTYFNVSPSSLEFGEVSVADVLEKSFEVTGKKPGPFMLEQENTALPEGVAVDMQPVDPDAEGKAERWQVKVTLGPGAREGNMGLPINLRSSEEIDGAKPGPDGTIPRYGVTVMATGRVRGLISWEPQYLSYGLVRPGQVVSRTFTVRSFDPEFSFTDPKWHFSGTSDNQPEFKWAEHYSVSTTPTEDGKGVEVQLTLDGLPEDANGSFQGRLIFETNHPSKPEVPVLFSGVCRAGSPAPAPGGAAAGGR